MQVQLSVSYVNAIWSKFWAHLMQLSINYFISPLIDHKQKQTTKRKQKKEKQKTAAQ